MENRIDIQGCGYERDNMDKIREVFAEKGYVISQ